VEDVDTLVAMLIQSERFGTSMGESLRVHSENLRAKRSVIAEEAAAKIALKLLFPLVFCIFPTLMLVLIGPAGIQVYHMLPAMLGKKTVRLGETRRTVKNTPMCLLLRTTAFFMISCSLPADAAHTFGGGATLGRVAIHGGRTQSR
jgi:hypothetical protein